MSARAAEYQDQIAGLGKYELEVGDTLFDGIGKSGALVEAEGPGYGSFLDDGAGFAEWFQGVDDMVTQATNQLEAAGDRDVI